MVVERWFFLLILGLIFTKGYCRDSWDQRLFENAVLKATCMLECNSVMFQKPCVSNCRRTSRRIKDLDEEAEAGVRLVCRDESYVVLAHNPGIYVIEQFEDGYDDVSRDALVSTGLKVKLTGLLNDPSYHWLFYRVSAKGISRPERSANISTIPPRLSWDGAGAVTNVTTQLVWSEHGDISSIYWESRIIFTPSQDRTCFYEVICSQEDGNYHRAIELAKTEEFSVTFERLPSAANFTVNILTPTDAQRWRIPGFRFGNITETITNFSTPRCIAHPRGGNICVPDAVMGLNASATHSSGNEFDVHVTWNGVEYDLLKDAYMTYIINIDPSGAGTENQITKTVDGEWRADNTENEFVFSAVRISDHFDVYISARNRVGEGPKISRRFTNPKSDINRTVSGIDATTTHKLGNTFDILVTWKMPKLIPDFYIVNITSNWSETNDRTVHNVSGSATETGFSDVEVSEQFTVHVTAWYSFGAGPEIMEHFKTPQTPDNRIASDAIIVSVSVAGAILAVIVIGTAVYRFSKLRKQKLSQSLPKDEYEINPDRLVITRVLGKGAFGIVKFATLRDDQGNTTSVAVKMLRDDSNENDQKNLLEEIKLMKTLKKHPNIVSLLGYQTIGPYPFLVIEYCPRGDLHSFLRKSLVEAMVPEDETTKPTVLSRQVSERGEIDPENSEGSSSSTDDENYIKFPSRIEDGETNGKANVVTAMDMLNFGRQIATGMDFLSSNRIVHRDLAARNILVCRNSTVKIADFGMSRDVYKENIYKKCGNGRMPFKWMAIESLTHQIYSTCSDVWSFGVLLWEIVTLGGDPYPGIPTLEILIRLQSGYRMERPVNCSIPLWVLVFNRYNVMLSCWQTRPRNRPTFAVLRQELDKLIGVTMTKEYFDLDDESKKMPSDDDDDDTHLPSSRPTSATVQVKFMNELEPKIILEDQEQSTDEAGNDAQACDENSEAIQVLQS